MVAHLNWGILGCGRVARQAVGPGIQRSTNGTIVAAGSRTPDKAGEFAAEFGAERAHGSYDELIADSTVQAVYVALPNSMHCEWTIRAAEAGKHVLCEKPLAANALEALRMAAACRTSGVTLMEAFAHTFHPHNRMAKRLIEEGRIGKLQRIAAVHSGARPPDDDVRLSAELAGGALMDKGCYCVNTARYLFGVEPLSAYATAEFGDVSRVDERLVANLNFPGGGVAHFETSLAMAENRFYSQGCEIFGDRGRIYLPFAYSQVATYRFGTEVETAIHIHEDDIEEPTEEKVTFDGVHQWQLQVEYFAERVLAGLPLEFPAEDGVANMRVIDAIYASARRGVPVDVM